MISNYLFQVISRYQDQVPKSRMLDVRHDIPLEEVAILGIIDSHEGMWPYEAKELLANSKITKTANCMCIWGEEEDMILTKIQ